MDAEENEWGCDECDQQKLEHVHAGQIPTTQRSDRPVQREPERKHSLTHERHAPRLDACL